tara:strand:+ start:1162 stop:2496 length:1335 start_codon:yes stop_codon:yes gene_type:complete
MKLTHLVSATVLIEHKDTKILCDPWLEGKEYYGSWNPGEKLDIDYNMFDDVDYIYISHIHPDHMSKTTLDKINKDIPILIHSYDEKFVKMNLERWGRKVIELDHGDSFHCGDDLNIHIFAADDCNPEVCFRFFGCGKTKSINGGTTGIDTMAVIENGDKCILNVNDCPYELSKLCLDRVVNQFNKIDLLLVGYAGAGSYPQCWHYSDEEKLNNYGITKKNHFLNMGLDYINHIKPKNYMPFAGTYILGGKYAKLERFKVVPTLDEALDFYKNKCDDSFGFLLNPLSHFDLKTNKTSSEYIPIDREEQIRYCEEVLIHDKYDYEHDDEPKVNQIMELIPEAYKRYDQKRKELSFSTDTNIYLYLPDNKMLKISADGSGYDLLDGSDFDDEKYVTYKVDSKLLYRILRGPKYSHWNNAEIGSHIEFSRKPEIYERKLYYSMNFFHR